MTPEMLTPTTAADKLCTERRTVIEFCLVHSIPFSDGRIDMSVLQPLWNEHNNTSPWHP